MYNSSCEASEPAQSAIYLTRDLSVDSVDGKKPYQTGDAKEGGAPCVHNR